MLVFFIGDNLGSDRRAMTCTKLKNGRLNFDILGQSSITLKIGKIAGH